MSEESRVRGEPWDRAADKASLRKRAQKLSIELIGRYWKASRKGVPALHFQDYSLTGWSKMLQVTWKPLAPGHKWPLAEGTQQLPSFDWNFITRTHIVEGDN